MQDSTDTRITYRAIRERAEQCARDAMPTPPAAGLPKVSTIESWESYVAEIEAIESYEIAYQSAEWDWVIYYHQAMELCQAVPSDVLAMAEEEWHDMSGPECINESFGLYEFATNLASIIVTREIVDAIEQVREELLELADDRLDQLESESV